MSLNLSWIWAIQSRWCLGGVATHQYINSSFIWAYNSNWESVCFARRRLSVRIRLGPPLVRYILNGQSSKRTGFLEAFSVLFGGLAHLGERLPCTQEVTSSSLVSSTKGFRSMPAANPLTGGRDVESKETGFLMFLGPTKKQVSQD